MWSNNAEFSLPSRTTISVLLLMLAPAVAEAENLAGVQKLICAPVTAADCPFGEVCNPATPTDIGVPAFVRIDLEKKQLIGPEKTSPIRVLENADDQLLLGGAELGFVWSMAIDLKSGDMSATVTDRDGAVVLHGACTAL